MKHHFLLAGLCLFSSSCTRHSTDATPTPKPVLKPVANFTVLDVIAATHGVSIRNASTNATEYSWSWGDGTTSTDSLRSFNHDYDILKSRRILLKVTSPGGTDTISRVIKLAIPAPTNVAGQYKGRLYYRYSDPFTPTRSWQRDTIINFPQVTVASLKVFDREAVYEVPNNYTPYWGGHIPDRNNYFYNVIGVSGGGISLQREWFGDSIYVQAHIGGRGGGADYSFYGKKY